jgi:hypothetical protein
LSICYFDQTEPLLDDVDGDLTLITSEETSTQSFRDRERGA